jgi:hypothetical protein
LYFAISELQSYQSVVPPVGDTLRGDTSSLPSWVSIGSIVNIVDANDTILGAYEVTDISNNPNEFINLGSPINAPPGTSIENDANAYLTGSIGHSGYSGYSGADGDSGTSGVSGYSGADGDSGVSGYSGANGDSGTSGYSGANGDSGTSGYSGADGDSGVSGYSGADGDSGTSGYSGAKGESGSAQAGAVNGGDVLLTPATSNFAIWADSENKTLSSSYLSVTGTTLSWLKTAAFGIDGAYNYQQMTYENPQVYINFDASRYSQKEFVMSSSVLSVARDSSTSDKTAINLHTITNYGITHTPLQSSVRCTMSGPQILSTSKNTLGGEAYVEFLDNVSTSSWDIHGEWDNTNHEFTATISGTYLVTCCLTFRWQFASSDDPTNTSNAYMHQIGAIIHVNGLPYSSNMYNCAPINIAFNVQVDSGVYQTDQGSVMVSDVVRLNPGQKIKIQCKHYYYDHDDIATVPVDIVNGGLTEDDDGSYLTITKIA